MLLLGLALNLNHEVPAAIEWEVSYFRLGAGVRVHHFECKRS